MFESVKPFGSFAVADPSAALDFYGGVLRLNVEPVEDMEGLLAIHIAPDVDIVVYEKADHVPATFTVLNLPVKDIDAAVDALLARGVRFLRYEGFNQDKKGIARGKPSVAWFNDPSGNILAVMSEA